MENLSPHIQLLTQTLVAKYGKTTLSKRELCSEFGIGLSTLNQYMKDGIQIPNYKKIGTASNGKVLFNVIDVAEYLSDTTKTV